MEEDDDDREGRVASELLARQAAAGAERQAFEATSNARLAKGAAKINPRKKAGGGSKPPGSRASSAANRASLTTLMGSFVVKKKKRRRDQHASAGGRRG